jgi:hypothetical protein
MENNIILFDDFSQTPEPIHTEIAVKVLHLIIQFQMFHWQSNTMKDHKIFDDFINEFKNIGDKLIEVISGTFGRVQLIDNMNIPLRNLIELDPIGFLNQAIDLFSVYKTNAVPNNPEIVSIIDDIIALFQQTKYLLSFN